MRSGDSGRQCRYGEAQRCHEPSGGIGFLSYREISKKQISFCGCFFDVVTSNPPYMIGQHGLTILKRRRRLRDMRFYVPLRISQRRRLGCLHRAEALSGASPVSAGRADRHPCRNISSSLKGCSWCIRMPTASRTWCCCRRCAVGNRG